MQGEGGVRRDHRSGAGGRRPRRPHRDGSCGDGDVPPVRCGTPLSMSTTRSTATAHRPPTSGRILRSPGALPTSTPDASSRSSATGGPEGSSSCHPGGQTSARRVPTTSLPRCTSPSCGVGPWATWGTAPLLTASPPSRCPRARMCRPRMGTQRGCERADVVRCRPDPKSRGVERHPDTTGDRTRDPGSPCPLRRGHRNVVVCTGPDGTSSPAGPDHVEGDGPTCASCGHDP